MYIFNSLCVLRAKPCEMIVKDKLAKLSTKLLVVWFHKALLQCCLCAKYQYSFQNHETSSVQVEREIYAASAEGNSTTVCRFILYITGASLRVTINPVVDLRVARHLPISVSVSIQEIWVHSVSRELMQTIMQSCSEVPEYAFQHTRTPFARFMQMFG